MFTLFQKLLVYLFAIGIVFISNSIIIYGQDNIIYAQTSVLEVDGDNPGCSNNTGTPYCDIQPAINDAVPGTTIQIKDGEIYDEVLTINTDNITIENVSGHVPVIQSTGAVDCIININADNVTVHGLDISVDQSVGTDNEKGVCVSGSDASIQYNNIHHITYFTTQRGGTLIFVDSSADRLQVLTNTLHSANVAIEFNKFSSPAIDGVTIRSNMISDVYGGIYGNHNNISNITIAKNTFSGYDVSEAGNTPGGFAIGLFAGFNDTTGQIINYVNSGEIVNNLIYGWKGLPYTIMIGGRNVITPSQMNVINNTILDNDQENTDEQIRGAIFIRGCYYAGVIKNNIIANNADIGIYGNEDGFGQDCDMPPYGYSTGFEINYNDVYNNAGGNYGGIIIGDNNLSVAPDFIDSSVRNYHFKPTSPLIDKGTNLDAPLDDIENTVRPIDGDLDTIDETDIGVYEYVPLQADLQASKMQVNTKEIIAGEQITYTLTITNAGPDLIYDVIVTDTFQYSPNVITNTFPVMGGLTIANVKSTDGTCQSDTITMVCHFTNFTNTEMIAVVLDTSTFFSGTVTNSMIITPLGHVIETAPINNEDVITSVVRYPTMDLQVSSFISKVSSKNVAHKNDILAGDLITYTVIITNAGPDVIENVILTDTFLTGHVLSVTSQTEGACNGMGTEPIVCQFTDFTNTEIINFVLQASVAFSGTLTNTVVITAVGYHVASPIFTATLADKPTMPPLVEIAPTDNTHVLTAAVRYPIVDLHVSKTRLGSGDVIAGENITYVITVTNVGLDIITDVVLTDTFSGGTIDRVTNTNGTCEYDKNEPIVCHFADLTNTEIITVMLNTSLSFSDTLTNTVVITPIGYDVVWYDFVASPHDVNSSNPPRYLIEPDHDNNEVIFTTIVRYPIVDLQIHKERLGEGIVKSGEPITYTITITNVGTDIVDVVITDTFTPKKIRSVKYPSECQDKNPVVCQIDNFTGTKTLTLTLITQSYSGTLTNTAFITCTSNTTCVDKIRHNNRSQSVNTSVVYAGFTDLQISQVLVGRGTLNIGEQIAYTILVTNADTTETNAVITNTFTHDALKSIVTTSRVCHGTEDIKSLVCHLTGFTGTEKINVVLTVGKFIGILTSSTVITPTGYVLESDPNDNYSKVDITVLGSIYLPLVVKGMGAKPDMVIKSLIATSNQVQIIIKNQGEGPVIAGDEFWVDFYVDPNPPPTRVNDVWYDGRSEQGIVWLITAPSLPINPGDVVTLTYSTDTDAANIYYSPDYSNFTGNLSEGTKVYAQVDSANIYDEFGGVLENHECENGIYNNVYGHVLSTNTANLKFEQMDYSNWITTSVNPPSRAKWLH